MNLVKLTDLDDYLGLAQDCVVMAKSKTDKVKLDIEEEELPKKPSLIKVQPGQSKASVNLYDCLACSGCVTTSEVVLMEVGER